MLVDMIVVAGGSAIRSPISRCVLSKKSTSWSEINRCRTVILDVGDVPSPVNRMRGSLVGVTSIVALRSHLGASCTARRKCSRASRSKVSFRK